MHSEEGEREFIDENIFVWICLATIAVANLCLGLLMLLTDIGHERNKMMTHQSELIIVAANWQNSNEVNCNTHTHAAHEPKVTVYTRRSLMKIHEIAHGDVISNEIYVSHWRHTAWCEMWMTWRWRAIANCRALRNGLGNKSTFCATVLWHLHRLLRSLTSAMHWDLLYYIE